MANGAGYVREGTTIPAAGFVAPQPRQPALGPASQPPRPPDTDFWPWSQTQDFKPTPLPSPLDLGPPLPPWHAEDQPASREALPEPEPLPIQRRPPPEQAPPPGPSPSRTERLAGSSGALAGKGEVSNAGGQSAPRRLPSPPSPVRLPPERGPAAVILAWRRGHNPRRLRMASPVSLSNARAADAVGRAPGFVPREKVGGIGGLTTEPG